MCRSCSELCLQVIWITSPVTSLRTIHRVLLHPLEEDMDLANRHALPQNTDLFCFCKMIVYWASQHLAWNITFTINYIDIYTWSAGDTPVNCLFVHEFHGVLIHVTYTNFHLLVSLFSKCFWLWSFFELLNFMKLVLVENFECIEWFGENFKLLKLSISLHIQDSNVCTIQNFLKFSERQEVFSIINI